MNEFEKLLNYWEDGPQDPWRITPYLERQFKAMLRLFSREEIEIAIDIAKSKGGHENWAKYIWGILWTRKRTDGPDKNREA